MKRLALAAIILSACGGSSDDPFTSDLKMICNASGDPNMPPDMQRISALKDITRKIKTPEAARLLVTWSEVAPSERADVIAPALAKAKIKRCPFLE